jgi:CRISPR-associated protein Csm4
MPMQIRAVYMRPKSTFITWPASDTLFGALCWATYHLYGKKELENMLTTFNERPKFILSSAFPYLERGGNRVRFFPKPLLRGLKVDEVKRLVNEQLTEIQKTGDESLDVKRRLTFASEKANELKKVSHVSEYIFKNIVEGRIDLKGMWQGLRDRGGTEEDLERMGPGLISYEEREKVDPDGELKTLFTEWDVLRNQIDRLSRSTVEGLLFYNKEISLHRNCGGLWFLVKTQHFEFLKALLRYLQDSGIGGERSLGKGHFRITWDESPFQLPEAQNPNSFVILSRWFPDQSEQIFGSGFASWNLLNLRSKREMMYPIGGERILKDLLRMFSEGSIFPLEEKKEYYGRLIPAGNMGAYVAYHNGLAMPVFAKVGG